MKFKHLTKLACATAAAAALAAHPSVAAPAASLAALPAASPLDAVDFHVYLPLQNQAQLEELVTRMHDHNSAQYQQWLTPADFLQRFGPSAGDVARVKASMKARGFSVIDSHAHGVHVRGSAAAVAGTFQVDLRKKREDRGQQRFIAMQAPQPPNELQDLNVRVLGLESIPHRRVNSQVTSKVAAAVVNNRYGASGPYWFTDLKQAYDYPAYSVQTNGKGVKVAVLMADLLFPGDVAEVFNNENFSAITHKPVPAVTTTLIDGGGVVGGPASFEASLDVQQVLGGAPGADVTLVSLPDLSDAHIAAGYRYIVDSNAYDIVSSSFGGCELSYTAAYNGGTDFTYILQTLHEIFLQGNAQGITFVASSGDQGGLACPSPDYGTPGASPVFLPGVSSPANDPNVTAVGGGNLVTKASLTTRDSSYVRESAFGDPQPPYDIFGLGQNVSGGYFGAGGGVSTVFAKPLYQALANTGSARWRTVPDIGMQVGGLGFSGLECDGLSCSADDSSVFVAYGAGTSFAGFYATIGTSVAAPQFVGALALFEQSLGKNHRLGNVNYLLYAKGLIQSLAGGAAAPAALQFYHRNIPGNDGLFQGGSPSQNYDYIYGNGSPDVRKLFGLTAFPPAGIPQTPSNP
jgi:subtilase family serine protease